MFSQRKVGGLFFFYDLPARKMDVKNSGKSMWFLLFSFTVKYYLLRQFGLFMSSLLKENQVASMPAPEETELGKMEYDTVVTSIREKTKKQKRKNSRFTDSDRYPIGKYAAIYGATAAVKKFKKSHPHLKFGESTARSLRDKYCEMSKSSEHAAVLQKMQRGRPLVLGTLDEKVKNFLTILRRKGGIVNTAVAIATAQALIARSQDEHLKCIDLESSSWAKSLFNRMGFVKRTCTTSKPEIPEQAMKEAKLIF